MAEAIVSEVEFREIPNYPGYRIGSDGTVWSRKNFNGQLLDEWKLLTLKRTYKYLEVGLAKHGRQRWFRVHRLILEAFKGPRPAGCVARHLDGNGSNNAVENLEWSTQKENIQDKRVHGTWQYGERVGTAKLTESQVAEAKRLRKSGMSLKEIAGIFRVHLSTIGKITTGVNWAHVA